MASRKCAYYEWPQYILFSLIIILSLSIPGWKYSWFNFRPIKRRSIWWTFWRNRRTWKSYIISRGAYKTDKGRIFFYQTSKSRKIETFCLFSVATKANEVFEIYFWAKWINTAFVLNKILIFYLLFFQKIAVCREAFFGRQKTQTCFGSSSSNLCTFWWCEINSLWILRYVSYNKTWPLIF